MSDDARDARGENETPFVYACDDGWASLIRECHAELLSLDPNYLVLQVKEKFGGLRYYYATTHDPNDPKSELMRDVVARYERLSLSVCEECGERGELTRGKSGWWKTTCDACRR